MTAPSHPAPPPVTKAPTRAEIIADTAKVKARTAQDEIKTTQKSAKLANERQGVYGNIKTSRTGDSNYGRWSRPAYVAPKTDAKLKFGEV